MADTNELLQQLVQKLDAFLGANGAGSPGGIGTAGNVGSSTNDLRKETEKLTKELKDRTLPTFGVLTKSFIEGKNNVQNLKDQIVQFETSARNANNAWNAATYDINRNVLANANALNTFTGETHAFIGQFGKILVNGSTKVVKDLTNSLQSGADGISVGANLMSTAVGAASSGIGAAGNAAASLGGALTMMNHKGAKIAGLALSGLGSTASFASDKLGKLAEFGINVLSKEVEKSYRSFGVMNAAGAVFTDGLSGMRNSAAESMLTVEQFSKVIDRNSELISQSGLGMAEGARQIGRIGGMIQRSGVGQQLLNLGFTFEEQAALTAETVAAMRRAAGGTVADHVVAEQTAKYAENLRIIAGITGEDAKRKVEEARAANTELAFQQKIAQMSEEQRAQLNAAMASMTAQEQQNLRERIVFGTVINREGAIMEATVSSFREKGERFAQLLEQNQLTTENVAKVHAQFNDTMHKQLLAAEGLAIAAMGGADSVRGVASAMAASLQQSITITESAVNDTLNNVRVGMDTIDELTSNITSAQVTTQQMAIQLQDMLNGPISMYSDISKSMVESTQSVLESLGLFDKKLTETNKLSLDESSKNTISEDIKDMAETVVGGYAGMAVGAKLGASVGSLAGPIGAAVGSAVGGLAGSMLGATAMEEYGDELVEFGKDAMDSVVGWFKGLTGKATGGISRGPTTGYFEKLHGVEAVIPTVGDKVPVDVSISTDAIRYDKVPVDVSISTDALLSGIGNMIDMGSIGDSELNNHIRQLVASINEMQMSTAGTNEKIERDLSTLSTSINSLVSTVTMSNETQRTAFEKMVALMEQFVEDQDEYRRLMGEQLDVSKRMLSSM